jgi:hypothetical protein
MGEKTDSSTNGVGEIGYAHVKQKKNQTQNGSKTLMTDIKACQEACNPSYLGG